MSEWPTVKLVSYCTKIGSGATPRGGSSVYSGSGEIVLIRSQNIYNDGFKPEGLVYIDEDAAEKLNNVTVAPGDVLLNITGDSVARVCLAKNEYLPARVNQHVAIIRPKIGEFDSRYLRYFLASPKMQDFLLTIAGAGATRNALTKGMIEAFDIPKPDLEVQKNIADILESLDNKIELNRQINQTLEQIAQTIFKSWFVDFEPVKAKIEAKAAGRDPERAAMCAISGAVQGCTNAASAGRAGAVKLEPELDQLAPEQRQQLAATAALFPDELVESELGLIPKGWEVGILADLCVLNAKSWGTKTIPAQVHYVDLANTKNGEISDVQIFSAENAPSRARRVLRSGDTIIGTVRPGNRSFALIGSSGPTLTGSTGFAVLSPKREELREIVYMLTTGECNIDRLTRLADGAAYPAVRPDVVVAEVCVVPSDALIACFHKVAGSIFDQRLASAETSETLSALRDTLLPKLLAGELTVATCISDGK